MQKHSLKYRKKKSESYRLITRLYNFIRNNPDNIIFKKISRDETGYYDPDTENIVLDYGKDFIPTLIHEFIHHIYPDLKEKDVCKKEQKIMSVLSLQQFRNIMKLLTHHF